MSPDRKLDFVIGEDKNLSQLLDVSESQMLLDGAKKAGAFGAEIVDSCKLILAFSGNKSDFVVCRTIFIEGEPSGIVLVYAPDSVTSVDGIADMLHSALQTLINGTMKRMLTSEAHTSIVNRSYTDLLESNEKLKASEMQFRELAATLEIKVQERTEELNRTYAILLQKEKLAAIGGLAAGMAHEINTPIGFVISNLHTLAKYSNKFKEMLQYYRVTCEPLLPSPFSEQAESYWEKLKMGYVFTDIDSLIEQSLDGAERIRKLVAEMRGFSHVDEIGKVKTDINVEIEHTLTVLQHEIRQGTQIERNFGTVSNVTLNPSLLSMALLQILQNALQLEVSNLKISINTSQQSDNILIQIADNGPGIDINILDRIFEPFFTTKDVGAGTGMGLTIAGQAIQSCGGTVTVSCPAEGGTVFTLSIPVESKVL